MYKILIADDELNAREGLRYFLNWEELGFTVSGVFEDGADVINYLKEDTADVVLADICMYDVSGLDVAQHIAQYYPHMKVIIVSGYSEFEYLRESIRLGVIDYMLKPLKQDDLTCTMLRVRAMLDAAQSDDAQQRENLIAQGRLLIQAIETGIGESHAVAAWQDMLSRKSELLCRSAINDLLLETYDRLKDTSLPPRLSLSSTITEVHYLSNNELALWTVARFRELFAVLNAKELKFPDLSAQVDQYVTDHISEDFSIDDLASGLYISRSHLSHEFKRLTGENLSNYINRRRMTLAMSLLLENGASISNVAHCCGYSDVQYFNRAFRNYTGLSVREWRSRNGKADVRE